MSKTPRFSSGLTIVAYTSDALDLVSLAYGNHYLIDFSTATKSPTAYLPLGSAAAAIDLTTFGNSANSYRVTVQAQTGEKIYYAGVEYDSLTVTPTDYSLRFVYDTSTPSSRWIAVDWPTQDASIVQASDFNLCLNSNDAILGWSYVNGGSAQTDTATLPLGPVVQTSIRIAGTSQDNDYVRYRWTMPATMLNRKLAIEWWQIGAHLTSGDFRVEVWTNTSSFYSGTYTEMSLSTDSSGVSAIPNSTGFYKTSFDSGNALYYELRIVRNGSTSTKQLWLAGVFIGARSGTQGAAVSEWVTFTPTITPASGSVSVGDGSINGKWRRVGNSMEIEVSGVFGSTSTSFGTGTYSFNIPSGYSVDYTQLATNLTTRVSYVGFGQLYDSAGGGTGYALLMYAFGGNAVRAKHINSATTGNDVGATYPFTIGNTDQFNYRFTVPISEWSGSGTVNIVQNDVEYAWNSTTTATAGTYTSNKGYGPAGTPILNYSLAGTASAGYEVGFQTPIQPTDNLLLELSEGANPWWTPAGTRLIPTSNEAGTSYRGMVVIPNSTTTAIVYFRNVPNEVQTWSAYVSGNYRWRVRKVSGGQAVGFGLADATSAGLLSRYQEGTWVPIDGSGAGLTFTYYNCRYTRVGRLVFIEGAVYYPATANGSAARIDGLPFTAAAGDDNVASFSIGETDYGDFLTIQILRNSNDFVFNTKLAASITNANMSGKKIKFSGQYTVA